MNCLTAGEQRYQVEFVRTSRAGVPVNQPIHLQKPARRQARNPVSLSTCPTSGPKQGNPVEIHGADRSGVLKLVDHGHRQRDRRRWGCRPERRIRYCDYLAKDPGWCCLLPADPRPLDPLNVGIRKNNVGSTRCVPSMAADVIVLPLQAHVLSYAAIQNGKL